MTNRSPLALPTFSATAADAPLPAQSGARRLPVEQGADFRQPPGETTAAPKPARRPLSAGGLTFSDPDQI
ncbi:hypothetical protein ACIQF6_34185 [Kitasatospora sp. NPDC092948]|uniref:hypothetical protein n=1 Tax=Kitasatospora sp. NPDC092948 TaxID=3364088 RepID=UPI003800501B